MKEENKMTKKIALDLDGVVFDSETLYRVYTEIYDIDKFHKNSLIDNKKRTFQERYSWDKETQGRFYKEYASTVLKSANIMSGAEVVLKRLLKHQAYEFIIVTARSEAEIQICKNKLAEIGLANIKIYHSKIKKIDTLIEEHIDVIIDDDEKICKEASNHSIKALYFKNAATNEITDNEYLKTVNNWGEIYKYLILNENK